MICKVVVFAIAALVGASLLMPGEAGAQSGHRCHSIAPGCGAGAAPICICPSRQSTDGLCRWECGVLV